MSFKKFANSSIGLFLFLALIVSLVFQACPDPTVPQYLGSNTVVNGATPSDVSVKTNFRPIREVKIVTNIVVFTNRDTLSEVNIVVRTNTFIETNISIETNVTASITTTNVLDPLNPPTNTMTNVVGSTNIVTNINVVVTNLSKVVSLLAVHIEKIVRSVGQSGGLLSATTLPVNHTNGGVTWTSSDSSVIGINSDTGSWTIAGAGVTLITASIADLSLDITGIVGNSTKENIAPLASSLKTTVTSFNTWSGNVADNLRATTNGTKTGQFHVHPLDADGKTLTFRWNQTNVHPNFHYHNRNGSSMERIEGSTITFKLNGQVQKILLINIGEGILHIIKNATGVAFDEVVLTYSGDSQNYREIEIFAHRVP